MKYSTEIWGRLSGIRAGIGHTRLCILETLPELEALVQQGEPLFPLGFGTNLAGSDQDTAAICLRPSPEAVPFRREGNLLAVGCGISLAAFIRQALAQDLGGAAALVGIPGTLGAALAGNAGVPGCDIAGFVRNIRGIRLKDAALWEWNRGDGGWGYRHSPVPGGVLLWEATLELSPCDSQDESEKIAAELLRRKRVTPPFPSLGSTFKNPPGIPAGKILEEAGCKGLRCGAFAVSEHHANWVVNTTGQIAPVADYRSLLQQMKSRVKEHCGILLEEEVRFADASPSR